MLLLLLPLLRVLLYFEDASTESKRSATAPNLAARENLMIVIATIVSIVLAGRRKVVAFV
jgi:hypothetical protein